MKKLLTVALAAVLVAAMTVPAMAMHFEMNGQLRVRSWVIDNYWPNSQGDQSGDMEFIDQRFRVGMTWGLTESVTLKARADINEGLWGESVGAFTGQVSDPITGLPIGADFRENPSKDEISFDHMYASIAFPGAPLTMVVGRQDVTFGTGMSAKSDNRDRLKLAYKAGDWTIIAAYDKFQEDFEQELEGLGSDSRGWAAAAVGSVAGWKTGLLYYLALDESIGSGVFAPGAAGEQLDNTFHLLDWFVMGQAGSIALKGDLAYRWGEAGLKGGNKTDADGLGAYAGAFVNAGMTNFGLEFGWARGNDPNTPENEGAFVHDYHGPFNSIILWNGMDYQGYDNLSRGIKSGDTGMVNAMALKGSVTATPSEKMSLTGAVIWAQRDEVQTAGQSDELGVEADVIASYNLYDNVAFTAGFGYLWAGDHYGEVDDPWGLMIGGEVKF